MQKLKRFNKNNKLETKNILISLVIIIGLLTLVVISKSYAIYKLQQDYDVIKNKIGAFSMGDVRVAVLVDGKEASEFPSYETNYKVESIDCTNGVTATFDVDNWQINIADMSATSTKCTVSFNSKETNERTPVNMSKTELLALNEEYQNLAISTVVDTIYPIGSIYISTTDSSIDAVKTRFPGTTWVKYSNGRTLVGDDGETYIGNADDPKNTGGSSIAELEEENLPAHTHKTPESSLNNGLAKENGKHKHSLYLWTSTTNVGSLYATTGAYSMISVTTTKPGTSWNVYYTNSNGNGGITTEDGVHTHDVTGTIPSMTTDSCENCSKKPISVQDPYTVVYMYKRTA